jgi:hypothetical protein
MMSKKIEGDRTLFVDCDDTLVMWDLSRYPNLPRIEMDCYGPVVLVPNQKNVNLVRKFSLLGYTIIIWSQTGADWAEAVAKAVGLDEHAAAFMAKPRYHLDDLPSAAWCGERLWRAPDSTEPDPEAE